MLTAIGDGVTAVLGYLGDVIDAIVTGGSTPGALNAILPVVGVSIGIALVGVGIRYLRSMIIGW